MRRQSMCDAQKSLSAEKPWVPGHERTDAVSQRLQLQSQTNKKTPPHAQPFPQELSGGVLAGFGAPSFSGVPARGLFLSSSQEPSSPWFTTSRVPLPSPSPGPCQVEIDPVCNNTGTKKSPDIVNKWRGMLPFWRKLPGPEVAGPAPPKRPRQTGRNSPTTSLRTVVSTFLRPHESTSV